MRFCSAGMLFLSSYFLQPMHYMDPAKPPAAVGGIAPLEDVQVAAPNNRLSIPPMANLVVNNLAW